MSLTESFLFLVCCAAVGWTWNRSRKDREALRRLEERVSALDGLVYQLRRDSADPLRGAGEWESPESTPASAAVPTPGQPATKYSKAELERTLAELRASRDLSQAGEEDEWVAPRPVPRTSATPPPLPPPLPHFEPEPAPAPTVAPAPARPAFNWEQFVGVRLFAWLGGLALFFAAALGLKYSFEHNLVPPEVRAAGGFLLGAGLLVGGVFLRRREYAVTSQTLCATGVVILYAVTFACRAFYHFSFFGPVPTFLLMVLVTVAAFALAVRMDAQVVAVLGMLGGFLTPILLSTGEDNPLGLFGYLALLDLGLIAVVRRKRWDYLLVLAMAGTVILQVGWFAKFFGADRIHVAQAVFLGMPLLFVGAFAWAVRTGWLSHSGTAAAAIPPLVAMGVSISMMFTGDLGARPGALFTVIFGADLLLLAIVLLRPSLLPLESIAGGCVFALLSLWTVQRLSSDLLYWAFGLYVFFAVLHTVFPGVLRRWHRLDATPVPAWSQFFPALSLLLVLLPLLREMTVPWLFWGVVLVVDALAVVFAAVAGAVAGLVAVLVLTLVVAALWISGATVQNIQITDGLLVIGAAAVFFFGAGAVLWRRWGAAAVGRGGVPGNAALVPALSASLPFLLLILVVTKFKPANPSAVFALGAVLLVLVLGLVRLARMHALLAVGLGSVFLLQASWQFSSLDPRQAGIPVVWELAFYAVFLLVPFLWQERFRESRIPWVVSALAGPLQFLLLYLLVREAYPNRFMGLVPLAFSVPSLLALYRLVRTLPADSPHRLNTLAWFGGVTLFFITVAVPIQFDRQWITLAWALEGAALCWLFRRLPHRGLPLVGVVLLGAAFVRLALNPAVLSYHPRASVPILNWYFYTYGATAASLFLGARWLASRGYRLMESDVAPILQGLGTLLLFLLVNIEIADFFSPGGTLTFEFSGNFARDMTYTIAWALFAFGLLVLGIRRRVALVRYAGLGLLCVALLKLFLHDLARLNQLYRIGAFAAVAVIAIVASFLYQRFLAADARAPQGKEVL